MKIQDMILVIQNIKGSETNMLMTLEEYNLDVNGGAKGNIFHYEQREHEFKPGLRYVFDISDAGGKNVKLTWDLEGENLPDYLSALWKRGEISEAPGVDRKSQLEQLKAFTKREVCGILKEDFGKQYAEAVMLAGREITGRENKTPELTAQPQAAMQRQVKLWHRRMQMQRIFRHIISVCSLTIKN